MRALIVFIALLGLLVAGLWLAGAFDAPASGPGDVPGGGGDDPDETDPVTGLGPGEAPSPSERPAIQLLSFPEGTRALLLARDLLPDNAFTLQVLGGPTEVGYQSWYLNGSAEEAAGGAQRMRPLTSMPTAEDLEDQSIGLLILDNINPRDLSEEFWASVEDRVQTGRMGLLVQAYPPFVQDDSTTTVHPLLTHPVLKGLVPIADALPFEGHPTASGRMRVPGLFTNDPRPFAVTEAGLGHAATQLVPWPDWSRVWWHEIGRSEGKMGTLFCYPVTKLTEGSKSLVTVEPPEGDPIPAIVVGPEDKGRVIWLGVPHLGWDFHWNPAAKEEVASVLHNLLAWLAGA